ncbi:MAG: hemerythrin family protein [Tissierellia bacterium]|nr:hemerythrin family protein [Tissierellia bacterium]
MFKWKEDFSVNIQSIDKQHQEIFKIGNFLFEIVSLDDGVDRYDEIVEALNRLMDYAEYHFQYEEELMKTNAYPKLEEHKKQHDLFIEKIKSIDEIDIDEGQEVIGMDLLTFVANWIENHILRVDMEYKDFLNSRGVY